MPIVVLLLAACGAPGPDEQAVAACGLFQDHLDAMRAGEDRAAGLELSSDALEQAERSDDERLAEVLGDYHRVIVRFALADDDVRAAEDRLAQAGERDVDQREADLEEAQERLAGLIEAGDLVLGQVGTSCDAHDVTLE